MTAEPGCARGRPVPVPHEGSCIGRHVELAVGVDADRDDGSIDVQCLDDDARRCGDSAGREDADVGEVRHDRRDGRRRSRHRRRGRRRLRRARGASGDIAPDRRVGSTSVVGGRRLGRDSRTLVPRPIVTSGEDVLAAPIIAIPNTATPPMRTATADVAVGLVNGQPTNRRDRERYRTEPATTANAAVPRRGRRCRDCPQATARCCRRLFGFATERFPGCRSGRPPSRACGRPGSR